MSGGSAYPGSYYQRPLLPVDSCFGGLAIYRYEALRGCRYSFRYSQPPHMLECEHVLFHQCIREQNGAKLFANPNM